MVGLGKKVKRAKYKLRAIVASNLRAIVRCDGKVSDTQGQVQWFKP